jgi:DNA-directed RNA polymerase specialized sigma24 family protein
MGEKELLKDISDKLDMAIRVLAINFTLGKKQNEQLKFLDNVGFKPKEIADMLGTTGNTVRVALAYIRKKSRRYVN